MTEDMTDTWQELLHGARWRSAATLWVENDTEHAWADVSGLADTIESVIRAHGPTRIVLIRCAAKLGCFAGQLAAWRAGCAAIADDGHLGPDEIAHTRPDLTLSVSAARTVSVEDSTRPDADIPDEVVGVNFTSGSTGSRKAVAVTRENLGALFSCRGLATPVRGTLAAGSFATPTYDGWWFDTWRTAADGGTVVCLPDVNEDVFSWADLVDRYGIDRLLLPAAVVATIVEVVPSAVAGIPRLFSGGEQFQVSTIHHARAAGLTNQFVNLYGPTEATFATHGHRLADDFHDTVIPIGRPLDGCVQRLRPADGGRELVVGGPFVCLGYLERGALTRRFETADGQRWYPTGDLVRPDDHGELLYTGRLDSRIKVNGMRVDTAALEDQVVRLAGVSGCRVVRHERATFAVALVDDAPSPDVRTRIEAVVRGFSSAIGVRLVDRFPVKPGGKVDTDALAARVSTNDEDAST